MNFCAYTDKNDPLAMIPSSEVFRLPRSCSYPCIEIVEENRTLILPVASHVCSAVIVYMDTMSFRTGSVVFSLLRYSSDVSSQSREVVERLACSIQTGEPTSTSRTVTPPAIFAVLFVRGGGRG